MMNYLQQNIGKLQAGGMPTMGVDPQMLAQMMSAQGAGQGVDYNGEPTPNVSGEPSFADMAQEIQHRYDIMIIPLQRKLEKLKAKLKENPTDQTIKNEIKRLEERIDQLEQQEDMELQQLEAEVEKSGEMIDQQKQMEGYGNMEEQMPEEDVVAQQSPEMMEQMQGEMPMMQKGGRFSPNNPDLKKAYQKRLNREFLKYQKQLPNTGYFPTLDIDSYNSANPEQIEGIVVTPSGNRGLEGYEIYNRLNEGTLKYRNLSASGRKKYKEYLEELASQDLGNEVDRNAAILRNDYKPLAWGAIGASLSPLIGAAPYLETAGKGLWNFMGTPVRASLDLATKAFPSIGASASLPTLATAATIGDAAINAGTGAKGVYDFVTDENIKNDFQQASANNFLKNHWKEALWTGLGLTGLGIFKKGAKKGIAEFGVKYPEFINNKKNLLKDEYNTLLNKKYKAAIAGGFSDLGKTAFFLPRAIARTVEVPLYNMIEPFTRGWKSGSTRIPFFKEGFKGLTSWPSWPPKNWALVRNFSKLESPLTGREKAINLTGNILKGAGKVGAFGVVPTLIGINAWNALRPTKVYDNSSLVMPSDTTKTPTQSLDTMPLDYENPFPDDMEYQTGGKLQDGGNKFVEYYREQHPTGMKGYLKDTPWTEYALYGNALAKLFDDYGRHNIEAQHQFSYSGNPYIQVYDRANRQYNDQVSMANKRYDFNDSRIRRAVPNMEYGSLQQANNARLAQQFIVNEQIAKNETDRNAALASIYGSYGEKANDAFTKMSEQNYRNILLNENERKSYLSAMDNYKKEKVGYGDQIANMLALSGKNRALADEYTKMMPYAIAAAKEGADSKYLIEMLNQLLKMRGNGFYIPNTQEK